MVHYELVPSVWHAKPLIFDWDQDLGVVVGQDAERIKELAADGSISYPTMTVTFSSNPLKNRSDMAAILAYQHHLPSDLEPFSPIPAADGFPDETYVDADGVTVIGRDQIVC